MKHFITILLLLLTINSFSQVRWQKPKRTPFRTTSTTTPTPPDGPMESITFSVIPFTDPDLTYTPFRAEEQWHGGNEVNIPLAGSQVARNDVYKRSFYSLNSIMTGPNTFNWGTVIADLQDAVNNRQGMSIGLPITYFDGADAGYYANFGGAQAAYPQWLHDSMQLETPTDWITSNNYWCINWNSPAALRALERLLVDFRDNVLNQTYNGVRYGDIINTLDIRFLGNYGEWHSVGIVDNMNQYPSGTRMTVTGQKRVIDIYCAILQEYQLQIMIAAFDCHRLPSVIDNDQEIAYYALSKVYGTTVQKKLGWRKDSYGSDESYLADLLQNNTNTFSGMRFDTAILNRYKYAPITGEPNSGTQMTNLGRDVRIYHTNSVGNSNYNIVLSSASQDSIRAASKFMGNRVTIDSGYISTTITKGNTMSVKLYWRNRGLCPPYISWVTTYSLRNSSNIEVYSATSTMGLRNLQPSLGSTEITDNFVIPTSVPSGTYSLRVIMKDPKNYRNPFPIYNSVPSRQSDGSYILKSNIVL